MSDFNFDREHWLNLQQQCSMPTKALVGNQFVSALSGETFATINPADGKILAEVAACDQADVDVAVVHARKAFESGSWSRMAPAQRKKVLLHLADLIRDNQQELALLETLDMGKPVRESYNVDVAGAASTIQWAAEAIDKIYGEIAPTSFNTVGLVSAEALGVVAAIVPWNFPLLMTSWKIAPALATGNSVILKPSEKSPLTALKLAELAMQAGIPKGVFQVLPGFGHTVGQALAMHMDIDALAFTGSTATGKRLLVSSGQSNMKRTFLECGGKSPNIVFADATDLDEAAAVAASAIYYNQGEVCVAGSRLLVENSIREEFTEKVMQHCSYWQPSDPLLPDSNMGPIVDDGQLSRVLDYVEKGQQEGAILRHGGKRVLSETGGYYIEPTLFDQVKPDMAISKDEIFGPVLAVSGFDTVEEAVSMANDSIYGLAAAVWTNDINRAHLCGKLLQAGNVWINCWDGGDATTPFGGFKQSGNGRDKSLHSLEKYTELKTTWINLKI